MEHADYVFWSMNSILTYTGIYMLQKLAGLKLEWVLLGLLALPLCFGCKQETSSQSSETAAYLADYESPEDKSWGFLNKSGTIVIDPIFDDVNSFSEGLAAVNQKGKWGYIDHTGKLIIPAAYKSAWAFHEGKARVRPFESPDCFIDKFGKILSSGQWSAAGDFSEGLALVSVGNTFGYVDSTGRLAIPAVYSRGHHFHHGLAIIETDEKTAVINVKGEIIIPPIFDHITMHDNEQIFISRNDQLSTAFDLHGKELAKLENSVMIDTDGNLISFMKADVAYFYDIRVKKIKPTESFTNIIYLGEQRWAGRQEAGYYLLDDEGKKMNDTIYSQINQFKDGLAVYGKDKSWGYLDRNGKELTGNEFLLAWDYKEGFARAAYEQGIAFIDEQQKIAFYPPPGTLDMRDFSEGLAPVLVAR